MLYVGGGICYMGMLSAILGNLFLTLGIHELTVLECKLRICSAVTLDWSNVCHIQSAFNDCWEIPLVSKEG
jgi:hypothetical protein